MKRQRNAIVWDRVGKSRGHGNADERRGLVNLLRGGDDDERAGLAIVALRVGHLGDNDATACERWHDEPPPWLIESVVVLVIPTLRRAAARHGSEQLGVGERVLGYGKGQ